MFLRRSSPEEGAWSSAAAAPTTAPIKKPKAYFIARSSSQFTIHTMLEAERLSGSASPWLRRAMRRGRGTSVGRGGGKKSLVGRSGIWVSTRLITFLVIGATS
jgi:hypothetical protein